MTVLRAALFSASACLISAPVTAEPIKPMRFFEGRTESVGTIKLVFKKPYRTRSVGRGVIGADGSLLLIQQVMDDGRPPHERRWQIRQIGPGRYAGTMSEANGPVVIDEIGGRYRFRFTMKGHITVEQWLSPLPDGMSASNNLTVRKWGMTVGTSDGMIRKIAGR